jgi:hypothetical protein
MPSPNSGPSRRGRKDADLWVREYDRKYTILDRLGLNPQLLVSIATAILILASCVFIAITTSQNYEKKEQISQLQRQIASLKPKAEMADSANRQLGVLQGEMEKLKKQIDSYKNCKCKTGRN